MNKDQFLIAVSEALDTEEPVSMSDKVSDIPEWDSLGILSLVDMLDEIGISIELDQFEDIETIEGFLSLVGILED